MKSDIGVLGGKHPPAENRIIQNPEEKTMENCQLVAQKNNVHTWHDFTQNTTIHGVKFIFDKSHFKLRR